MLHCSIAQTLMLLIKCVCYSDLYLLCNTDVESKRASGLTAIWLARNRFAVLDKTSQVHTYPLW